MSDTVVPHRPTPNLIPSAPEPLLTEDEQDQIPTQSHMADFNQAPFSLDGSMALDEQWFVPGLNLGNEWDLQGVDLAFFDSVFRFCGDE